MKAMSKQFLCLMLAAFMCLSLLPLPALAAGGANGNIVPAEVPEQTEAASAPTEVPGNPEVEVIAPAPEQTEASASTPEPEVEPTPTPEATESTPTPSEENLEDSVVPESPEPELKDVPETRKPAIDPMTIGQDVRPLKGGPVSAPLITVAYHYVEDVQAASPFDLAAPGISAHSYYPLAKISGDNMVIPANHFPGEIPVRTENLTVMVDGALDVTAQAEYDAATGCLYLPARYWGHEVQVDWFCSYSEVTNISISATVNINMGGAFVEETHTLTLPSNAGAIEIPLAEGEKIVVAQGGIDLPASAYSIQDGVLYVSASPLGGDLAVTAYAAAPQMRPYSLRSASGRPATVTHTRSSNQIYYGYYTSYYTANGNPAFCLDSTVSGLNAGTYAIDYWLDNGSDMLVKCCYYLYGGPGYDKVRGMFAEPDADWAYGMCHAVASYAYMGSLDAFKGLGDSLTGQLVQVYNYVASLPSAPSGFEAFVYNTGSSTNQPMIGWQYASPSKPDPEPEPTGTLMIRKTSADAQMTSGNICYSLAGAVFDVYDASGYLGAIVTTDEAGVADVTDMPVGSYYFVERTPPKGFAGSSQRYSFTIRRDETTTVTVENIPQNDPSTILLRKQDADTGSATPQGSAGLAGAQFTLKYYKGSYTSAEALANVSPARTWVVETDEDGFAMLHPDYLVRGDALYFNSAGTVATLPLGTLIIQETKAPTGYLPNNELFLRQITASGTVESVDTYNEPIVKESVIRGGISIEKWDAQLNASDKSQGDATLAGAVLEIVNRSDNAVTVGGKSYAPGAIVHTLTTDAAGKASTANNLLPYGEYEIREKTPPAGCLNTGEISRTFEIRTDGAIVELTAADTAIKNDVIRGNVLVGKWDHETGKHEAQGGATLMGAEMEIVNRSANSVLVQGVLYAPGEVVFTGSTDETGTLTTPELLLPYGTYEVREVKPPEGYLSEGVLSRMFEIREHGKTVALNTAETAIRNVPIRGDLEGVKIADGTAARLAGVPFKITSKTTGESHVVVTDANGQFSTASEWAPHSQNTNAGETHMDGVWFGEIEALNDVAGALPYDTYVLEEQPCAANENMELLTFEVSVYRNGYTIHLGTLTDDYIPQPEIFTTALEKESMTQEAYAAESVTTLDTVYYSGLKSGTEYVLKGILMDKATGEPLMIGEKQVTAEKTFRATAESGSVTMEFTFDASSLKGKTVVVFETLYLADTEIASHADIEDVEQSITFQNPQIGTSAAGRNGEKALDITAEAEIVDTVRYSGLIPGREYTLHGSLMDKATGEAVRENGVPISAETVFTAEAESGTVQVTFTVDAAALKGKTVVVFEHLLYRGREIAAHADIEDENQTVSFVEPKIGTSAADEKGKKVLLASSDAKIIDTVTYENLTVGKEYTLKGVLMDKSTGIPLLVGGKEITAEVKFKPDKAFGKVEVPFALDASTLAGAEVVVFETLYLDGREIAAHKDIEDEGQTVSFAELVLKLAKINSATKENLDGAEFTLYDAAGKEIKLSKDKDGVYYPDEKGSAVITTEKGVAIISGLSGGELTLKEIKAPDGFVGYTEPIKFTMTLRDASMDDPFPVTVYNAPEGSKTGSGAKTGRDGLPTWALTAGICALAAAGAVGFVWLKKKHMQ